MSLRVVLQRLCACGGVIASQELPGCLPAPHPNVHLQLRERFRRWLDALPFTNDDLSLPTLRIDHVTRRKCALCQEAKP